MKRQISVIAIAMLGFCVNSNAQTVSQTNVSPIADALTTVIKLNPVTFSYDQNWTEKLKIKSAAQNGFDLESLAKTAPQLIVNEQRNYNSGKNNTKTAVVPKVNYEELVPLLVGSIKEQQKQIDALKAELSAIRGQKSK